MFCFALKIKQQEVTDGKYFRRSSRHIGTKTSAQWKKLVFDCSAPSVFYAGSCGQEKMAARKGDTDE
jgi:hypothetical protein